jgi:DNA-binding NarL/FixJ family response regulator
MCIKIILAEDHKITREGLVNMLEDQPSMEVVGEAGNGREVQGMMQAGASGYLLKDCAFEELVHAIRAVFKGDTYLSPGIAGIVVEDYVSKLSRSASSASGVLTRREREVLQLISEGKSTKHIASKLAISIKTVETHRRQMMGKIGIRTVAGLTKYAIREGLTSPHI